MNWSNVAERAAWTFLEAFLVALPSTLSMEVSAAGWISALLAAACAGLSALKEPCEVTLYSDSKYLVDAINLGWAAAWRARGWRRSAKEEAKNPDLWETLFSLLETHTVTFEWVRGHNGHDYNERCDRLATAAADSYRIQGDQI